MRVYELSRRINHSLSNIHNIFEEEYLYYSSHNIRSFSLNGLLYESLYKRLNIQLLITQKCPFNCDFCIEKINPTSDGEQQDLGRQIKNLELLIKLLRQSGMEPSVSITGGEPTLFPQNCLAVNSLLKTMGVECNLNTAGIINDVIKEFTRINLSVHHFDPIQNSQVFQVPHRGDYWNHPYFQNATIQTVLRNPDFGYLTKFIDSFPNPRFSIRFIAETNSPCSSSFDWASLLEQVISDNRFVFRQQKVGDYYFFEEYSYGKKLVRFSFASLKQLDYYKQNEHRIGKNLVRAVVVKPDGEIQFDWIP